MSEWQPIETAPKGEKILVLCSDHNTIYMVKDIGKIKRIWVRSGGRRLHLESEYIKPNWFWHPLPKLPDWHQGNTANDA